MHASDLGALLKQFVIYVTEPGEKSDAALLELCDRIVCAFHDIRFTFDEREYAEAPRARVFARRPAISAHFPEYGAYSLSYPDLAKPPADAGMSHAIDDLEDLVADFSEILWRLEHTSVDDALWHFHFGYATHWGHHLRSLQLYLFSRIARA